MVKILLGAFPFGNVRRNPADPIRPALFIPAQYDGSRPACVYVKADGYNPREKSLLETLIATKSPAPQPPPTK